MKNIFRVILFFTIAITVSNIFRFNLFEIKTRIFELYPRISIPLITFLEGGGVLFGALIAIHLMKKSKDSSMSLFGNSRTKSILLFTLPIIVLTIIGINNSVELNPNIYGFVAAISIFIYCVFEEYGWRGYLQDELSIMKPWKRYLLIGFLWYLWHLPFVSNTNIIDNITMLAITIVASWGIGQIAIATKSIIACAAFHFVVNIFTFNNLIKNGFEGNSKWIAFGVIFIVSVLITQKWPKSSKNTNGKALLK